MTGIHYAGGGVKRVNPENPHKKRWHLGRPAGSLQAHEKTDCFLDLPTLCVGLVTAQAAARRLRDFLNGVWF
jgi:hypothetical protein